MPGTKPFSEIIHKCHQCKGDGIAPQVEGKLCKSCYGSGRTGKTLIHRLDGRVERVCGHGVGHPVCVLAVVGDASWAWTHDCDGCCADYERYTNG